MAARGSPLSTGPWRLASANRGPLKRPTDGAPGSRVRSANFLTPILAGNVLTFETSKTRTEVLLNSEYR